MEVSKNNRKFSFIFIWLLALTQTGEGAMVPGRAVNNTFTLGYLLSWTRTWVGGQYCASAINVAIKEIHRRQVLHGYDIEWIMEDTGCEAAVGTKAAVKIWSRAEDLDAFIGDACSLACEPTSLLAAVWNLPIISYGCSSDLLSDKSVYATFTRSVKRSAFMAYVISKVGFMFDWTHFCILSDKINFFLILARELETILKSENKTTNLYILSSSVGMDDGIEQINRTMNIMRSNCRILYLLMYPIDTRNLLAIAYEEDMLRDYVYLSTNAELPIAMDFEFRPDLGYMELYEGVFDMEVTVPEGPRYDAFRQDVIDGLQAEEFQGWANLGPDAAIEDVNVYAAFIYDSVLMWAYGVNKTLEQGHAPDDGRRVTQNIMSLEFEGMDGPVTIDKYGDRDLDYVITTVQNGKVVTVLRYTASNDKMTKVYKEGKPGDWEGLIWPGNKSQIPTDGPPCGWKNEFCESDRNNRMISNTTAGTLSLFLLLVILLTAWIIRNHRIKQKIKGATESIISWDELEELNYGHLRSQATIQSAMSVSQKDHFGCKVLRYKTMTAAALFLESNSVNLFEKVVLKELQIIKTVDHENLNKFIGVCASESGTYVLMAYATHGSVCDIISGETSSLTLDLRVSLIKDVANGMKALHATDIGWHGHLKSNNCVVDSRWVCKITDYGLHDLRKCSGKEGNKNIESLLWTAPELLRNENRADKRKADVYSFGIICQELVTCEVPYGAKNPASDIIEKVRQVTEPPFRPLLCEDTRVSEWCDIITSCWEEDPRLRPKFSDIVNNILRISDDGELSLIDSMIKRLEGYSTNLEEVVTERSMELFDEKDKMEHLLKELLPNSIVESLKLGNKVEPEMFDSVTVLFSDIVSFTRIAAAGTPIDVVKMLNMMYTVFDDIATRFDVYKVATIGDAYFVTSGVPIRNGDQHASQICALAAELLEAVSTLQIPHLPEEKLQMRIGIHSGSCLGGVVGVKMPRYLLFGDTIDIASNMESGGEDMRIHISKATATLLEEGQFQLEPRENGCLIKGQGVMETFWLSKRTPYKSIINIVQGF